MCVLNEKKNMSIDTAHQPVFNGWTIFFSVRLIYVFQGSSYGNTKAIMIPFQATFSQHHGCGYNTVCAAQTFKKDNIQKTLFFGLFEMKG
jgi:hypothetical protein